jgi:hypothetical protein
MNFFKFHRIKALLSAMVLMTTSTFNTVGATEGGASHYAPGTYNDFFMNMLVDRVFIFVMI